MRPGKQPPLAYRALLRLFPRTFREEFGDDMGRLFVERREEAGRFRLARAGVWADRSAVLRQAIGDGIKPALVGVALGLGAAAWAARLLANLLYEIGPSDTATFVATPVVLVAVAVIACAVPAWRASRLDPVIVLRHD